MNKEIMTKLYNIIATRCFVNCYSSDFYLADPGVTLEIFLTELREGYKNLYVEIDINLFRDCVDEEQEAGILLEQINLELTAKRLDNISSQGISLSNVLLGWGKDLDQRALLVFCFFHSPFDENEKNILRSLRKTIRNKDEISRFLGILIVTDRDVSKWELFPESNLDERDVVPYLL